MAQITSKELTAIDDLLGMETLLSAKYEYVASKTEDAALKDCYTQMAQRHKQHTEQLYGQLK